MEYSILTIEDKKELETCPMFYVDQFNWGGEYRPVTYGQFAYENKKGFRLKMTCEESHPVCHYHRDFEPVWMDSAMEGFFAFGSSSDNYVNLEVNSAGAMVASYGSGKTGRTDLTLKETAFFDCHTSQTDTVWSLELFIPLWLIEKYFHKASFDAGDVIRMNFFKLAQGKEMTHFASFSPISSPEPNFHLPEFFARGIL